MTLRRFVDAVESPSCSIAVVGGESSGPLESMLAETFEGQPIAVDVADTELLDSNDVRDLPDVRPDDDVLLLENGTVAASSSMDELYDALLAINSDLFVTGAQGVGEIELPDVLASLDEFRFTLRGYPLAHNEKLLLIVISRYVEQLAWEAGSGTLRSAFQELSRIDDEIGTRQVYERLDSTAVDVHAYGIPDREPTGLDLTVHAGRGGEYRDAWFVVFSPDAAGDAAALVALETEPRIWDGFWTYDDDRVAAIDEYIAANL